MLLAHLKLWWEHVRSCAGARRTNKQSYRLAGSTIKHDGHDHLQQIGDALVHGFNTHLFKEATTEELCLTSVANDQQMQSID